jgi:hypothetical protein
MMLQRYAKSSVLPNQRLRGFAAHRQPASPHHRYTSYLSSPLQLFSPKIDINPSFADEITQKPDTDLRTANQAFALKPLQTVSDRLAFSTGGSGRQIPVRYLSNVRY